MPILKSVSSELPDPPYPADIKANGWKPELDIDRICQSDTWTLAENDERPWLLRVWLEAWRSVPVGSMPGDRAIFARRIGCTRPFLEAHAGILLRGWRLHSDEHLYHDYITEQVERMLNKRVNASERQRRSRENKKAKEINETSEMSRVSHCESHVSHRQEQEQEQEQEEGKEKKGKKEKKTILEIETSTNALRASVPDALSGDVIPEGIDADAWSDFCQHRREIRKPLTDLAAKKNANVLRGLSFDEQRTCVDTSIANRWTGLFPPKASRHDEIKHHNDDFMRKLIAGELA